MLHINTFHTNVPLTGLSEVLRQTPPGTRPGSGSPPGSGGPSPGSHPARGQRFERVGVAQQLLLLHLVQDVLAQHPGQAQLSVAHQPEHQVHQLLQDVIRQLRQAAGEGHSG